MPFMAPEIAEMEMFHVERNGETTLIPSDVFDFSDVCPLPGESVEIERNYGWYARLSASGYMDCTEWSGPFETEAEALSELCSEYDIAADGEPLSDLD